MIGAAATPRPRAAIPPPILTVAQAQTQAQSPYVRKPRRSAGRWIVLSLPVLVLGLIAWQLISPMLRSEIAVRDAIGFSTVSLETDPVGSRIDFAVVDRVGQETTVSGDVNVKLREPDGTVWQTTRPIAAANFGTLPAGGLLAGRTGYSVVIPASDWLRAPRRGGSATVTLSIQPTDGVAFSTVAEQRFP